MASPYRAEKRNARRPRIREGLKLARKARWEALRTDPRPLKRETDQERYERTRTTPRAA